MLESNVCTAEPIVRINRLIEYIYRYHRMAIVKHRLTDSSMDNRLSEFNIPMYIYRLGDSDIQAIQVLTHRIRYPILKG